MINIYGWIKSQEEDEGLRAALVKDLILRCMSGGGAV